MALDYCCGCECGVSGTGMHWTSLGASASFDTTTKRSGERSIRLNPSAATTGFASYAPSESAPSFLVLRAYVRFATLPGAACVLFGNDGAVGAYFNSSDSKIYAGTGTAQLGASGVSVTTGVWYRLDVKLDDSANTVDVQVDGSACGQKSGTAFSLTTKNFQLGTGASSTYDIYFDDIARSVTSGDYPIGAGYVNHFVPTADGTHNIAGTGDFQRGNTGTDILNATTTAYQLVDDVPLPSGSVSETDNIRCVAPANPTTDYVECIFGPASGISTPTTGPRIVDIVLVHHEIATQTGEMEVRLNDNGSFADIYNPGSIAGVVTYRYARAAWADPPSAASAWHANNDGSNGDFRDLRFRVLGIDAAPDQCLDGIMLEAEFADANTTTSQDITGKARIQATVNQTQTGKAAIQGTTTRTQTGVARIQKVINATQTGLARIQKVVNQTVSGVARIHATANRTQTGVARVQKSVDQTQTGKAAVIAVTNRTQTGLSRITATTLQAQTGKARIQNAVTQNLQGVSRIQVTTARTQTGKARIQTLVNQTINGLARITASVLRTVTGVARIQKTVGQTITGVAKIEAAGNTTTNQDQTGKARITASTTQNLTGRARLTVSVGQTQLGRAAIRTTTTRTQTGLANIIIAVDRLITGLARISVNTLRTITGTARVTVATSQNTTGTSRIQLTASQTISGRARIIDFIPVEAAQLNISDRALNGLALSDVSPLSVRDAAPYIVTLGDTAL